MDFFLFLPLLSNTMRFLFYLGHPAHYHNSSVVAKELLSLGHDVLMVARDKDVLFRLLEDQPFEVVYLPPRTGNSKMALVGTILSREVKMTRIALKFKPDLLIGTDIVIAHVAKLLGKKSIILNEDDVWEIPFFTKFGIKYCDTALSPISCGTEPYDYKTVKYPGFHELAYLHPNHFTPLPEKVKLLSPDGKPYFILRFSALSAHHDDNIVGITNELSKTIIQLLEPHGKVYVTSERELDPEFEPYRIGIHPKEMHHALHYASIYIGDSQTMAAESAVLGTPSLRFNDFVGKLGYLEELEKEYGLTYGFKTSDKEGLLNKLRDLLQAADLKSDWKAKREKMLSEKMDVAAYWTWFFTNYPASIQQSKEKEASFIGLGKAVS